jgi:hypothetical protein
VTRPESSSRGLDQARCELDARAFHHVHLGVVTDDDLAEMANGFGRIAVEARDPRTVRAVSPSSEDGARKNTLSSRYGFGAFPKSSAPQAKRRCAGSRDQTRTSRGSGDAVAGSKRRRTTLGSRRALTEEHS